ncbi:MAG: hypothetical protein JSU61_03625, partial [Fidelibacterota bacterium]
MIVRERKDFILIVDSFGDVVGLKLKGTALQSKVLYAPLVKHGPFGQSGSGQDRAGLVVGEHSLLGETPSRVYLAHTRCNKET